MSLGLMREREVLLQLAVGLPQEFLVFHNVNWSSVTNGTQCFGELDAVVLAPSGHIVLLEVKAGEVRFSPDGAFKTYGGQVKDVQRQTRIQFSAIKARLADAVLSQVRIGQLLVLPDQRVDTGTVGNPLERIVDARQMPQLCQRVCQALPLGSDHNPDPALVRRFFENRFELALDPSTYIGQVGRVMTALSDGLATWVPRIESPQAVYVIEATAGSGKTQLALRLLQDASDRKQRCLYVCFNRSLADHLIRLAPTDSEVCTFHELAMVHLRRNDEKSTFNGADIFTNAANQFIADSATHVQNVDVLVIDESQDFEASWVQALLNRLKPDGKLYLMGDTDQALYERDGFELSDATTIRSSDNFRSPRQITAVMNALNLTSRPLIARCAFEGDLPGFHAYGKSDPGGLRATERVLKALLSQGFDATNIALLSYAGRERSKILASDKLAGLSLRKFTGQYDKASNAIWSTGSLLADSVYRFKGQSAPVVVLCEIDFDALTDRERKKLFVGMSRAQLRRGWSDHAIRH
jgi:thymidine kinase